MNKSDNNNVYYIIDRSACNQNGFCQLAAPGSIAIDAHGYPYFINGSVMVDYSVLINPPSSDESELLDAIASCPNGCISRDTSVFGKR